MRRRTRSVPAMTLMRRLGWHRVTVACRDRDGRRAALHLCRRSSDLVEVELPGGNLVRLTNVEAGKLRAALRDVLIDHHRPHRAGAA
jgi:hypothetical protein